MKISELIEELQELLNKEGNIPVVNYNFEDNLVLTIYPNDDFYDKMLIIE